MKRILQHIIRTATWIVLTILLVGAIVVVLFFTGALNPLITRMVNQHAGRFIEAELNIRKIEGKPISGISVKNLLISDNADTLVYVETIRIEYILKLLLNKTIQINELYFSDIRINLVQEADSTWNLLNLIPQSESEVVRDTSTKPFDWIVDLKKLSVNDLEMAITTLDSATHIPERLKAGFSLGFRMENNTITSGLTDFSLHTFSPGLVVVSGKSDIILNNNLLNINQFYLKFPRSEIFAETEIDLERPEALKLNLDAPVLDFEDFRAFLEDIPLYGQPRLTLNASDKRYHLDVESQKQRITLEAWLSGLEPDAEYTLTAVLENLNMAEWTLDNSHKSKITGNITAKGKGFEIHTNQIEVSSRFSQIEYAGYSTALNFRVNKNNDNLQGNLSANSLLGNLKSWFQVSDIFKIPAYFFRAEASKIDVSQFVGDSLLASDIGFTLKASGRGYLPESMKIDFDFESTDNVVAGVSVDSIGISAGYHAGNYRINLAKVQTPWSELNLSGEGKIDGLHDLNFLLRIDSLNELKHLAGADSLNLKGSITGRLTGSLEDLSLVQSSHIEDLVYNTYRIEKLHVFTDMNLKDKVPAGNNLLSIRNADIGGILVDSLMIETYLNGNEVDNLLKIVMNDSIRSEMEFGAVITEKPKLNIPRLDLFYKDLQWTVTTDTIFLDPVENRIEFPSIEFLSGQQNISAWGVFSMDSMDVNLSIKNLDPGTLPLQSFTDMKISGLINSDLNLSGSAEAPMLKSRLLASELKVDTLDIDTFRVQMDYADNLVSLNGFADMFGRRIFSFEGAIPFHLSLTDSIALLADDRRFFAKTESSFDNLELFASFFPSSLIVDGSLNLNMSLLHSIKNPEIDGSFRFENGRFNYPEYGVNLQNMKIASRIDDTRFILDSLWMQSGRGWLNVNGFAQLAGLDSLFVDDFSFRVRSDRFTATNGPQAEIVIKSDATVQGNRQAARFNGKMELERGVVHIDALMSQFGMVADDPNPPLLLKALDDMSAAQNDTSMLFDFGSSRPENELMKNLNGEFDIEIPGNLWVRGKDMNFELAGNLKAIQESGQLDLFGLVEVRRGHYTLYGKRLMIEKGEIQLTGGSDINPLLDVSIAYSFRDSDKQLRKLTVDLSGRALNPEITFNLDAQRIEEKDGIAYLMFGKSLAELTQGEQSSVSLNAADIGRGLALGQLSGLLQGALQSSLGLDMIDFEGEENWSTGSVTIGKYLTRNLFMRYSREFSLDKKSKVTHPDQISLEYQIFRWLYLQAISEGTNSGFDLIFQKRWR